MTYCVAMLLDAGIVFASDSRTSAGVDHVNTFCKMTAWERPGDRVLVLLSSGNLAITQAVVNILNENLKAEDSRANMWNAPNMFAAARQVGEALREVHRLDGHHLREFKIDFNGMFILGGQIKSEPPRLFTIYSAGNFIEASPETPYFQIGELKYGKPIIDRVITRHSSIEEGAKCALLSMDSTMKSNISVAPPLDLLCYEADSLRVTKRRCIENDDAYFNTIRKLWGEGLRQIFSSLPDIEWKS